MNTVNSVRPPSDTWVAAIHAGEHDQLPLGSAVVIDVRRVLTCAHVVVKADSLSLWVSFPKVADAADERRAVISIDLIHEPPVKDLAVLTLEHDVPRGVKLAPLRSPQSQDLVDRRWWAFGFPDGDAIGEDADGTVGAALARGWLRLDTNSRYLIKPGFSGGGLWSPDYEAVVGIVAQAHPNGDGRAITLHQANLSLPDQKLDLLTEWSASSAGEIALSAWGWSLAEDPEGARHWRPRARGVSVDSERGFRFRGRTRALTEITNWLDRRYPDRQVLVVTGSPGAGKSAILGRIVTTADEAIRASLPMSDDAIKATPGSVACAVHAKGKTALDVATEIARAASVGLPVESGDLAPAMRSALQDRGNRRFNVIIDALDESTSPDQARAIVTKIVLPLVETCSDVGAQVVVGTRRYDDGGSLLEVLGRGSSVIDLDKSAYLAAADLAAYALACLQLVGDERKGNPYDDLAVAMPVAHRIAELSDRNFLVAGIVGRDHGMHDQRAVNANRLEFDASVEAVLNGYLDRASSVRGLPAGQALTVLAFAEAPGLPASLWRLFVEALYDRQIPERELFEFARTTAANFLIETGTDGSSGPVFRLFHQALDDALLRRRSRTFTRAEDERCLTRTLVAYGHQREWQNVEQYALRSLPAHAASAGLIDELLSDEAYLLHADLNRLVLHANHAVGAVALRNLQMIGLTPQAFTATSTERAALFSVTQALEYGQISYGRSVGVPYVARWARAQPRGARAVLEGHHGGVWEVCSVTSNGLTRLASASSDCTIRIWDPATGQQTAVLEGHLDRVNTVCLVTIDGLAYLASAGDDRTIRVWDPLTGEQIGLLEGHRNRVNTLCPIVVNGQACLASAGDDDIIRIWSLATGEQTTLLEHYQGSVLALCSVNVKGQTRLASAGSDRTIRVWDPLTGEQIGLLEGHRNRVNTLCAFTVNGQTRLASAGSDRTIRVWDPLTGKQIGLLEGHRNRVNTLCAITVNGQTRLASAGEGRTIRVWDPFASQQSTLLEHHQGSVMALCPVTIASQNLFVSAGADGTIRMWDPANSRQTARYLVQPRILTMCWVTIDGQAWLASGGDDGTIRIRDLASGRQTSIAAAHQRNVLTLCPVEIAGHIRLASAGDDRTIRIWDPANGEQTALLEGHLDRVNAVCPVTVDGQAALASVGGDGTIRIWDPNIGQQTALLQGRQGGISALCPVMIDGQCLLASASDGAKVIWIWDPATSPPKGIFLVGHQDTIQALCPITVLGQTRLASASSDGTIRIWDPATKQTAVLQGHRGEVNALCPITVAQQTWLVSASSDGTVRIWDPTAHGCALTIPMHHVALALAWTNEMLAIGLDVGIVVINLNPDFF